MAAQNKVPLSKWQRSLWQWNATNATSGKHKSLICCVPDNEHQFLFGRYLSACGILSVTADNCSLSSDSSPHICGLKDGVSRLQSVGATYPDAAGGRCKLVQGHHFHNVFWNCLATPSAHCKQGLLYENFE